MKKTLSRGLQPGASGESAVLAQDVAIRLLERSIAFGHRRLAVVRLAMAVKSGATVPQEHWLYCREVATTSREPVTQNLFLQAAQGLGSGSAA